MSRLIVEFSGWIECDPEKVMFQYFGKKLNTRLFITGTEWMKLSPKEQDDYLLEVIEAQKTALDGECEHHTLVEEAI